MHMEDVLQQILEGQKQLFEEQKQLFEGQKQLFEGQRQLLVRVEKIDDNLSELKGKVDDIKEQQDENTLLIGALMHRTEELDAKFDGLLHNTLTKDAIDNLASKEDIASLDAKFEVLNSRLFHQEAEMFRIKAVK